MITATAAVLLVLGAGDGIVNHYDHQVAGSYIVRFSSSVSADDRAQAVQEFLQRFGGELEADYSREDLVPSATFNGWSDPRYAQEAAYDTTPASIS